MTRDDHVGGRPARRLPRGLSERLDVARRDLRMLLDTVRGIKPPPLVPRTLLGQGGAAGSAGPGQSSTLAATRVLRVAEVVRETADAVTLVLEDPSGRDIGFTAGQFFTLVFHIDGTEYRRAYSICSGPEPSPRVAVTCKRMPNGKVSAHVTGGVEVGSSVRVLGPSGNFLLEPAQGPRHLVFLAGGSGITPFMAMTRWVLAREPETRITLVYGNRSDADVIFGGALRELARIHRGQLRLIEVLSDPPRGWNGRRGLLDVATLGGLLGEIEAASGYFVCGPEPMMVAAREALLARGVAPTSIHEEKFTQPHLRSAGAVRAAAAPQTVTYRVRGKERVVQVPGGQTVLDAGLAAGVPMKFSCTLGGCGACRVRLVEGTVEMEEPNCLDDGERKEGYILACVAHPTRGSIVEVV